MSRAASASVSAFGVSASALSLPSSAASFLPFFLSRLGILLSLSLSLSMLYAATETRFSCATVSSSVVCFIIVRVAPSPLPAVLCCAVLFCSVLCCGRRGSKPLDRLDSCALHRTVCGARSLTSRRDPVGLSLSLPLASWLIDPPLAICYLLFAIWCRRGVCVCVSSRALSICLSICQSACLHVCVCVSLSVSLSSVHLRLSCIRCSAACGSVIYGPRTRYAVRVREFIAFSSSRMCVGLRRRRQTGGCR